MWTPRRYQNRQAFGGGGGGGAWTPSSLGGALKRWYKADTGVTVSGGNVTTWADQSGNGINLTGFNQTGNGPRYGATSFPGSLPAVYVNTPTDGWGGFTTSDAAFQSSTFAIGLVWAPSKAKTGSGLTYPIPFSMKADGDTFVANGAHSFQMVGISTDSPPTFEAISSGMASGISGSRYGNASDDIPAKMLITGDGSTITTYVNGTTYETATQTGALGNTNLVLSVCSDIGGSSAQGGEYAEFFLSTSIPTVSDFDAYVLTKWGF